jgi:dCMP deaminase
MNTGYRRWIDMRPSWDDTWMEVSHVVARRSRCVRRQVGAVAVDRRGRVIGTGVNGPPAGFPHDGLCHLWCPRATAPRSSIGADYGNDYATHAETNLVSFTSRDQLEGGTIYVSSAICFECGKMLANCGVTRIVCEVDWDRDIHRLPARTIQFMRDCGIVVDVRTVEGTAIEQEQP